MSFFKTLFGGKEESPEEKKHAQEALDFDKLKYSGVRALKIGQVDVAVQNFLEALEIKDDLEIHDHLSVAYVQKMSCKRLSANWKYSRRLSRVIKRYGCAWRGWLI